ncbi:hypothetical protein DFJ74DRAFT_297298 [Hyaloraphidium curvatum]|nr:hypothetical protein DFJ74DRAFT_297298 [Hyaloraphidium curvatum]
MDRRRRGMSSRCRIVANRPVEALATLCWTLLRRMGRSWTRFIPRSPGHPSVTPPDPRPTGAAAPRRSAEPALVRRAVAAGAAGGEEPRCRSGRMIGRPSPFARQTRPPPAAGSTLPRRTGRTFPRQRRLSSRDRAGLRLPGPAGSRGQKPR